MKSLKQQPKQECGPWETYLPREGVLPESVTSEGEGGRGPGAVGAVDKTLAKKRECTKLTGEEDVRNRRREIRKRDTREMILCVVVDVIVVDGRWREAKPRKWMR